MGLSVKLFLFAAAMMTFQGSFATNVVEVYFIADGQVLNRYINEQSGGSYSERKAKAETSLTADVDYLITQMNVFYKSLETKGISIRIAKKKLDILNVNLWGDNARVDPSLKTFDGWLEQENKFNTVGYDAAIFWTGYELIDNNGDKGVAGYAHVGTVCSKTGSGIVEFDMTYHTALTTAHELGHILGAGHDSASAGFVMIPTSNANEKNRWAFSLCTREAFDGIIAKLDTNCMASTSPSSQQPNADITDALGSPDTICRRSENNQDSYFCSSTGFYGGAKPVGDVICSSIWCKDMTTKYCKSAFSSDGMICGTNKRCLKGSCINHPDSESAKVDENCMWGDQKVIKYNTNKGYYEGDCAGFLKMMGKSVCSQDSIKSSCCKTCEDATSSGNAACPYGNTFGSCEQYEQWQICDNYNDICCEFCQGYKSKRGGGDSGVTLDRNEGKTTITDALRPDPKENKKTEEEETPEAMA